VDNQHQTEPNRLKSVLVSLRETSENVRSNEKAFEFKIVNGSATRIHVRGLRQWLPDGVNYKKTRDMTILQFETDYRKLCEDLRFLINDEYLFGAKQLIEARKAQMQELIEDVIVGPGRGVFGVIRSIINMVSILPSRIILDKSFAKRLRAIQISVDSLANAKEAIEHLNAYQASPGGHTNKNIIETKLALLEDLEYRRTSFDRNGGLVSIDAGETLVESYVISFPRRLLKSQTFPVSFELQIVADSDHSEDLKRASQTVEVTPSGWMLSVIAIAFALIGGLARNSINLPTITLTALTHALSSTSIWIGGVTALVIFNIFDRLNVPWAKRLSVSSPSAAVIGFACGLYSDNFLKAIQAFFTTK
jgi:hypothetical protein